MYAYEPIFSHWFSDGLKMVDLIQTCRDRILVLLYLTWGRISGDNLFTHTFQIKSTLGFFWLRLWWLCRKADNKLCRWAISSLLWMFSFIWAVTIRKLHSYHQKKRPKQWEGKKREGWIIKWDAEHKTDDRKRKKKSRYEALSKEACNQSTTD